MRAQLEVGGASSPISFESRHTMKKQWIALLALLAGIATTLTGQTSEKKTLTLEGAESVITAAKAEAKKVQAPGGVIAVVDDGGNLMALERLDGTFAAGANISIGKAKTAVMFKKPTRFFEELINSSGKGRTVMTALEKLHSTDRRHSYHRGRSDCR